MAKEMMDENNKIMQKSIRVLIVDDIYQVRQELATVLKLAARLAPPDIEVVGQAQNGLEAIEQAKKLHPDVVLMDLEMPGMNGYTATESIKSTRPSIKVIIFTIHGENDERQNASKAGADAFIEKGIPIGELIHTIQRFGRAA